MLLYSSKHSDISRRKRTSRPTVPSRFPASAVLLCLTLTGALCTLTDTPGRPGQQKHSQSPHRLTQPSSQIPRLSGSTGSEHSFGGKHRRAGPRGDKMGTREWLCARRIFWTCQHNSWTDRGVDLSEFNVGLHTSAESIALISYMLVEGPGNPTVPKLGFLRDLNWKLWVDMVWSETITTWKTRQLNLPDITEALREEGIPFTRQEMKTNQALGAWGLDCAFTEALVRLGIASSTISIQGVGNTTYGKIEVENPFQ